MMEAGPNSGRAASTVIAVESHAGHLGRVETRVEVRRGLPGNIAMFTRLGYRIVSELPHPRDSSLMVVTMACPMAAPTVSSPGPPQQIWTP